MNSGGEYQDENTGQSGPNQFLNVCSPGGGKPVGGATQRSPLTSKSILKPSSRENLLQCTPSAPDKGQVRFLSQPVTANITPGRYAGISELDQEENWKERATVVTKLDHEQYTETVNNILVNLVDNLPISEKESGKLEGERVATPSPPLPNPTPNPTVPCPTPELPAQDVTPETAAAPLSEAAPLPDTKPDQVVLEDAKVTDPSPDSNKLPEVECLPETQVDLLEIESQDLTQIDLSKPENSSVTGSELPVEQPSEPEIQKPSENLISLVDSNDAIQDQNEVPTSQELKPEPETIGEQLSEAKPEHLSPVPEPTQTNLFDEQPLPSQTTTAQTDLESLPLTAEDSEAEPENLNPVPEPTQTNVFDEQPLPSQTTTADTDLESLLLPATDSEAEPEHLNPVPEPTQTNIFDEQPLPTQTTNADTDIESLPLPAKDSEAEPELLNPVPEPTQTNSLDEQPLPTQTPAADTDIDSLPLPAKGSYNFDWDNFDENSNPFETKTKIPAKSDPVITAEEPVSVRTELESTETLITTESVPLAQSTQEEAPESSTPAAVVSSIQPEQKEDSPISAVTGSTQFELLDEAKQETAPVPSSPSQADSTVVLESGVLSPEQEKIARLDAEISTHTESDLSTEQLPELGSDDLLVPEAGKELPVSIMSDTVSEPVAEADAIPVAKGSYNIDWDNLDDSINPFETKTKVGGAPKVETPNKNKTPNKSKTPKKAINQCSPASSSPQVQATKVTEANTTFTSSPVKSPSKQILDSTDINQNTEVVSSNVTPQVEPAAEDEPREGGPHDLNQQSLQDGEHKPPAKKPPSGIKKVPKRFKPPAVQKAGGDEIEIFAPPPPSKVEDITEDAPSSMPKPLDHSSPELAAPLMGADEFPDDEFKPATEAFIDASSWDMLEKFGGTDSANFKESALARQSLYVKFDPLVKGKSPAKTARIPSTEAIAEGEDSLLLFGTPPPNKGAPQKHPAARNLEARVLASDLPPEDTEPGITSDVDRIFSCSPGSNEARQKETSTVKSPEDKRRSNDIIIDHVDIVHVLKYSQFDLNRIKKELELDFQAKFLAKERDWQKERDAMQKAANRDSQIIEHELKNIQAQNIEMKKMVADYEMTMTQMITDKESSSSASEQSLVDLVRERDTAIEDLHSVEAAFSDLHRRFEKSKAAIEGFKKNEETFKKCLADLQQTNKKHEEKYQALKKHAEDKLEQANAEIDRIRKSTQSELTRLQAGMKRAEIQIHGLEQQVEQKVKENTELTAICDELINKVDQ